jgi:arylsulfatase A-like enzyme
MFRAITAIDDNVGKLLELLDELKLTEDTVVCFSSDNGYYLGEHGLGDKRSAYEESMRIPMLVRYPRMIAKGRTEDRIVLNVDPAPTFLDLAGVPVPASMHGRSWKPLLEGKSRCAVAEELLLLLFLRARIQHAHHDSGSHRNGETHQVCRTRGVDRIVRPEVGSLRNEESRR